MFSTMPVTEQVLKKILAVVIFIIIFKKYLLNANNISSARDTLVIQSKVLLSI